MTGMTQRSTRGYRRDRGVAGMELLAGLAAAVAGGIVWALVVYYTEREFLYLVIGIGAGVGAAVAATVKQPNAGHGVSAAGFSVIGLMLGKLLIVQWSLAVGAVNDVVNDPEQMMEAILCKAATNDEADPEIKAWYLDETLTAEDVSEELAIKIQTMIATADVVMSQMDDDMKLEVAGSYVEYLTKDLSYIDRIKLDLSWWDGLWVGIAVVVAYQIGSGGGKDTQEVSDGPGPDTA